MPLKILLSSTLRKYPPGYDPVKGISFSVDMEITVEELCERINIPCDKIKIVMVNGKSKPMEHVLKGNERVGLFPPIGGG
ncbi:MAG: MoaD/ThiS family protein [Deltaproteobacteria bacterium]|nr:MoaD/ThiS family protein [Deltaproteobacteria bacterium]MBW2594817.1 MoaD/ThiS family protein [Deltaproteobacteria bacterium]MBW2650848.1 MoaD/ThiS family protein [Deltaproteobacteria bacterium]